MSWLGPDAASVVGPTRVLLLDLFCSDIQLLFFCTVESLSLLYLLFISLFICNRR